MGEIPLNGKKEYYISWKCNNNIVWTIWKHIEVYYKTAWCYDQCEHNNPSGGRGNVYIGAKADSLY